MDESTHTKIRNRTTKGVWDCPNDALDYWLANGWMKAAADAELTNDVSAVAAPDNQG
jgi:hypothetical protein